MRLISFLGTGDYRQTIYSFEGDSCRTQYVAHALASFTKPSEIHLIATKEAWEQHGQAVSILPAQSGQADVKHSWIPTTGEPENLWTIFATVVDLIQSDPGNILFDITHGFRAHPFFASACIQYIQSVLPDPRPIRVVYGEFRGPEQESPIWDLTPFLEVLSWSRNLMMFLRTGQADDVAAPTIALGRELKKQWAANRNNPEPGLEKLGKALEAFSNDFTTIRTGSLLVGGQASAQQLWDAIERTKHEVAQHLPALALVLNQVQAMVEPLRTSGTRLSSAEGQRALLSLARLYQKMGRYSEAISILREGWCTFNAPSNCDQPGTDDFNEDKRKEWDNQWVYRHGHADPTADLRNDIQHAGFRKQPNNPEWFKKHLDKLLAEWEHDLGPLAVDDLE